MMKKELRIVFMGTPDFAVESLKCLHEAGKNIVGVITAADKKAGRGQKLNESAVKKYAIAKQIKVLQPSNLKNEEFIAELKELNADLQIVVAFRMLPELVWNMPKYGTFNLHASLLPQYRGAAPINWAIINGEKETGVTSFFLKHEIDTGDIIFQEKVTIAVNETAGSLHDKLMAKGGKLVLKTVEAIENDSFQTTNQQMLIDQNASINEAPKIFREDCEIDWSKSLNQIDCFIRGLSPYPAAWTTIKHIESGKTLNVKVYEAKIENQEVHPKVKLHHDSGKVFIDTLTGRFEINSLQIEGKKRMDSKSLLNGFPLGEYTIL
ncbi:MAG: methionyl-tRNA formyltransferase [Flavobacteriales bacterium]|nr:methionyl-tRNA formyltransferase [Flavobacteriales bacterium]